MTDLIGVIDGCNHHRRVFVKAFGEHLNSLAELLRITDVVRVSQQSGQTGSVNAIVHFFDRNRFSTVQFGVSVDMVHGAVQGNTLCIVLDRQAVAAVFLHTYPS